MRCPVCGQRSTTKDDQSYCPTCQIFLGEAGQIHQFPQDQSKSEISGEIFRKRSRKKLLYGLVTALMIIVLMSPGVVYFFINYTSYGFREKVMYQYGFAAEARGYLRSETTIDVMNLSEKKPFGFTHSGYWKPGSKNIKLNTASDEVAIHEFAHAWWEKLRKDELTREGLINDMISLSQMDNKKYFQTIKRARWLVDKYCFCPDLDVINYDRVDDQHFYAYMADFTMGRFKDGSHKLPFFMWKYFEGLFSNNLKVAPCYETKSCGFPDNNGYSYVPNHKKLDR
ncbi:MAG TPA: hypothetical protein VF303_02280 [Candidatus Nanoarchaeia archaeon]